MTTSSKEMAENQKNEEKFFSLPKAKLVIFDCDGVLVDSEPVAMKAVIDFAKKHGFELTPEMAKEHVLGHALPQVTKILSKLSDKKFPEDSVEKLRQIFIDLMHKHAVAIEGAKVLLEEINKAEIPFRVGSNSSEKEMNIKFDVSGLAEEIEKHRIHSAADIDKPKPDPAVYLLGAKEENVKPEECIVVEDSDTGAKAALRAGMRCIILRDPEEPLPPFFSEGDFVIAHNVEEVARYIFESMGLKNPLKGYEAKRKKS